MRCSGVFACSSDCSDRCSGFSGMGASVCFSDGFLGILGGVWFFGPFLAVFELFLDCFWTVFCVF